MFIIITQRLTLKLILESMTEMKQIHGVLLIKKLKRLLFIQNGHHMERITQAFIFHQKVFIIRFIMTLP